MINIELKKDDIIFDEGVDISEYDFELIAYIKESDNLDRLFKIYNKKNHNEYYQVNYYGIYNYEHNNFYFNCCVTIYCEFEELKEKYPDIYEELISIQNNENNIELPKNCNWVIDEFKEYCLEDFKINSSDFYNCSNFNSLIQSIKTELEVIKDEGIYRE